MLDEKRYVLPSVHFAMDLEHYKTLFPLFNIYKRNRCLLPWGTLLHLVLVDDLLSHGTNACPGL